MKKANFNDMFEFEPQTTNQRIAYDAWDDDDNLVLTGSAGTGKTFVAMYLAIEAVLTKETPYDRVVIVRSVVPTRDMGFLPGTVEEKKEVFEIMEASPPIPYPIIVSNVSCKKYWILLI